MSALKSTPCPRGATIEQKFALRLRSSGECMVWTGPLSSAGYGRLSSKLAHRVYYELLRGPIPAGLVLDHLCRNRACCNPDHLEPVTLAENTLRGESVSSKNAQKTHCVHGHPLEGENLFMRYGHRHCRTCYIFQVAERNKRRREERAARGRIPRKLKTHCKHGHALSGDNVQIIHLKRGGAYQDCIECRRRESRESYYRTKVRKAGS